MTESDFRVFLDKAVHRLDVTMAHDWGCPAAGSVPVKHPDCTCWLKVVFEELDRPILLTEHYILGDETCLECKHKRSIHSPLGDKVCCRMDCPCMKYMEPQ